eukprot:SAG31_NODE_6954_length_1837_cov_1.233602_1_plen_441_part_10
MPPPMGHPVHPGHDDFGRGKGKGKRQLGHFAPMGKGKPPPQLGLDKSVAEMLTDLLLELGNPNDGPLEGNLSELVRVVAAGDLAGSRPLLVSLALDCAAELPAQVPVYATLAGLLTVEDAEFGPAVVGECQRRLGAAIHAAEVTAARLLMRFAAELCNASVLKPESLLSVFTTLVEAASAAAAAAESPKQPANFVVALVLESLIWGGKTLADKAGAGLETCLERLSEYMAGAWRPADFDLLRVFDRKTLPAAAPASVADAESQADKKDTFETCDYTEALYRVVQTQRADSWRCNTTLKPYLAFQTKLGTLAGCEMDTVQVSLQELHPAAFPLRTVFRVLDVDMDDLRPVDRLVCETHIIDAIHLYDFDHEERNERGGLVLTAKESVWRIVGGIHRHTIAPLLHPTLTKKQVDKLICETIFSQMFQLPQPPQSALYYSMILN